MKNTEGVIVEKYIVVQVETLDEGVIDSLKAPIQKVKAFLQKSKINIQEKLSPDKKKIILNAADVAIMFLPSLNTRLSASEVEVLEHLDDKSPEEIAPVIYKILKVLSSEGYIEEDESSFLIPRKALRNSSIAGFKARTNDALQRDELIARIKASDKKLELTTNKLNKAQNDLEEAKQRYNDIAEDLDRVNSAYKQAYRIFTSKEAEVKSLRLELKRASSKLDAKGRRIDSLIDKSKYKAAEIKKLQDVLKAEKERARNRIKELSEERDRLSKELSTYQGEINSCNKEVIRCSKEILRNRLEKEEFLQYLEGDLPIDDEVSEAFSMATVALTQVVTNFILWLVISILTYMLVNGWIKEYYDFQREALKINKKLFSKFGVEVNAAGFSGKVYALSGVGNMKESILEVNEEAIDIEDCLVFDESDIAELYSENGIDESILDGAISKARLLKKLYRLFSTGVIRVVGSKIIIDTDKIGGQENA